MPRLHDALVSAARCFVALVVAVIVAPIPAALFFASESLFVGKAAQDYFGPLLGLFGGVLAAVPLVIGVGLAALAILHRLH